MELAAPEVAKSGALLRGRALDDVSGTQKRFPVGPPKAKNPARIKNAFTVDVEDYFHVRAFSDVIDRSDWESFPVRVEKNTNYLLDLLDKNDTRATFFILGWVAERFPTLVKRIAEGGHEVASHGYEHEIVSAQSPQEFEDDIRKSKDLLENLTGKPILGYRAPTFSIGTKTWWAYEILEKAGYRYSSSIYPIAHDLYGMPGAKRSPFRPIQSSFLEIPLTTVRFLGRNFPASGGGYFRLLPYRASAWALRRVNKLDAMPGIFYCHPWEIDAGQPRVQGANLKARTRHYLNIKKMPSRILSLLKEFSWGTLEEVFLSKNNK
jgi:polysaccharide deacetylase family protein (PEP-CTERM system associated)